MRRKWNILAHSDDLHSRKNICAAGNHRFFLFAIFYPDLAIEAFAVPAKISVRDRFHIEKLQTAQDRIVFGHAVLSAEDLYLDQAVVRFEHVGVGHN